MRLDMLTQRLQILGSNLPADTEVTGITCDSREVKKDNLFVAIDGASTDGNKFIAQALKNGACGVISQLPKPDVPYIQVADSRLALASLSACFYGYPAEKLTMVAVTGTNGKSSVTWLFKQVLERLTGEKVGLLGTVENHLGGEILPAGHTTPQSHQLHRLLAAMVDNGCKYGVMEVSSHALHQQRVAGIRFQTGAFTNLSRDHLDYHKTMESYCAVKGKLFSQCERAVLNADDPWYAEIARFAPNHLCFSTKGKADIYARDVALFPDGVRFFVVHGNEEIPVTVPIPGLFTVYNSLCVLGLALSVGMSLEETVQALAFVQPVKGRAEVVPTPGRDFTVLIDYAHTPDAMENILMTLRGFSKGRLITLFGCGGDRDKGKRRAMGEISTRLSDVTILTSDNPRFEPPMDIIRDILQGVDPAAHCKVLENRRLAMEYAVDIGKKDDIIVLLGKGHESYQEICGKRLAFDEREILHRILAEKR